MNIWPFLSTFIIITFAELGDKTQFLAMGFAARFPFWEVMTAVSLASSLIMAVAVVFGEFINYYIPIHFVKLFAGFVFIIFGLLALKKSGKGESGQKDEKIKNPFWLIFSAFFLAELGDKTQIAAFALTAKYGIPFQVWLGATLGMILANVVGVSAGKLIYKRFSEKTVTILGAAVFLIFGLVTIGEVLLGFKLW